MPSVTNQSKETESDTNRLSIGCSILSPVVNKNEESSRRRDLELSVGGNGGDHEAIDEDIFLEDLKV